MFSTLMLSWKFAPLFWCQFFSAFNDNFLKNALVFLILFQIGSDNAAALVTLGGAIFIAPSFLLSGLGGELADRYDKSLIARRLKFGEIVASGVAVTGLLLASLWVLFAALFLFGVFSALFGPIKYGILPDHLKRAELPAGNALIEAATFLAILLGTIVGGLAAAGSGPRLGLGALVMGIAVLCWVASRFIPSTAEAAPTLIVDKNILRSTIALLQHVRQNSRVWRTSLMVAWFWLMGAVVLSLMPTLVKDALGGAEAVVTAYLTIFSIGVALGSALASFMASGRIILLPTPIAAILMGLFALDLGVATMVVPPIQDGLGLAAFFGSGPGLHVGLDFFGLAIAGGLYIVPSFAAVQAWSDPADRARVIAGVNVLSSGFMVLGTASIAFLQRTGLSTPLLFCLVGGASLIVGAIIFRFLPTNAVRDFLSILFRAFYRLEINGAENLKVGPNSIIALNHVSFLDAALALSLLEQEPIFAIDHAIAQRWWVKPFLGFTHAIPLDPTKPMATRVLINAVKEGKPLIIFPEGRLTVTGSLMKVYDGAGLIADKSDALIIPVKIEGLEQTPFSRLTRAQVRRRWWPKVVVTALEPVRLSVDTELRGKARRQAAGAALYQIMSDLIFRTTSTDRTVFEAVVEAANRHGMRRIAVEDPLAGGLSYARLLTASAVLGQQLMAQTESGKAVGVLLPNSNGVAVTVLSLMSAGRIPAMLNFTAGATNLLAACTAAKITTVVTSRAFVEKGKVGAIVEVLRQQVSVVYLEDVRSTIGRLDKVRGLIQRRRPLVRRDANDPAAILFTSGSEGAPKGVALSHRNILSNAAQAAARIDFGRSDKVFNVLPVFHSFGLTVGMILPLVSGVPVHLYPSPLHYRIIPELIYGVNATILFGTDTFLAGYARAAHAYDFRSLRYILAGAEPVKEETRRVYVEKFGLRILEGYGVTETAPALALNTPMFNRFGTVGRILPGMEVRIEPVPGIDGGGRLFVRGPNVMLGYLSVEKPGVLEPPQEGWHDTGDIVEMDAQGFVTIKGRAKRFAKIGGEMVSLAAVEALAAELWPQAISTVTAVPDVRKGERLILVTNRAGASRDEFQAFAKANDAAELMIPAKIVVADVIPLLGSGKVDHVAVAKLARELVDQPAPTAA